MTSQYLVQTGVMGRIAAFQTADSRCYRRGQRVVCRTERGLEIGLVVCPLESGSGQGTTTSGVNLRPITADDQMILERLERYRDRAFQACSELVSSRGLDAILVDVEHLFDGRSIYFYFLGDDGGGFDELAAELSETYESTVRFRQFARTLASGCGPDCGTVDKGCSTAGGCGSCGLKGSCSGKS